MKILSYLISIFSLIPLFAGTFEPGESAVVISESGHGVVSKVLSQDGLRVRLENGDLVYEIFLGKIVDELGFDGISEHKLHPGDKIFYLGPDQMIEKEIAELFNHRSFQILTTDGMTLNSYGVYFEVEQADVFIKNMKRRFPVSLGMTLKYKTTCSAPDIFSKGARCEYEQFQIEKIVTSALGRYLVKLSDGRWYYPHLLSL